jgi:2-dehydro-3-deoxygluconokinase
VELVGRAEQRPVIVFGEAMIELSGVEGDRCRLGIAGDTFNTAVYLARAGIKTAYMTAIGDEAFSRRIEDAFLREEISSELIARVAGGTPGLYAVEVDQHGERSFTYWRGQAAVRQFFNAPEADQMFRAAERTPLLYLSGISLSLFNAEERQRIGALAEAIRGNGGAVAFDTNFRPRGWASRDEARGAIEAFACHVTIALPTFEDDAALFGDRDPTETAERWRRYGSEEVVVKAGPEGAYMLGEGWRVPPLRLEPLDTTGAGDSFNGGYLAARLQGHPPAESVAAGHALAGQVLMTPGAILPRGVADG